MGTRAGAPPPEHGPPRPTGAVLLVSAVGIAYQVALMRVFSVAQWHHFAYMIISIAMLGFGASGTVLALARARLQGREAACLEGVVTALPACLLGCYVLSQRIPFEVYRLVTERIQLAWLLALYLTLAAPFFLISACIALGFMARPERAGRLYACSMLGSGVGAAIAVALLYAVHPRYAPCLLAGVSVIAGLMLTRGRRRLAALAFHLVVFAALGLAGIAPVRLSEYKGLSYALQLPDAEVVTERSSPLAVVTAVRSEMIRETPGQIAVHGGDTFGGLPRQIGLFFDAGAVSVINEVEEDGLDGFAFLENVTSAAAYRLVERPRALVLGAGGGMDVLTALRHGAAHVTAVEIDPNVLGLMRDEFREFSGGLYTRPDVTPVQAEGRGFLESRDDPYDLIHLPLFGSFTAVAAGVYALNESYLYTVEAFTLYLSRLSDRGVLSINCWLRTPPGDAIKLFATAVEACEALGIEEPARHLAFIRTWNNATILVSRRPLTDADAATLRDFCARRSFDVCHYPGMEAGEANRFNVLEQPVYYEAAQALLSPARAEYYRDYPLYVRPATDDRPHFFRFFKWGTLPALVRGLGTEWAHFIEWGYVTLVVTLAQSMAAGFVLIMLPPVLFARRPAWGARGARRRVLVYFGALGVAYMFLEIASIQKFMLFLAYPVYAVAVVLVAFLIFSGLGGLLVGSRIPPTAARAAWAVAGIAAMAALYLVGLPALFSACAGWADGPKIALSIALLAPIAFCMGIPFPAGLQLLSDRFPSLTPWAWAINGCASVVGATAATCAAVHLGFRAVVVLAVLAYLTAAWVFRGLAGLPGESAAR